jgi:hypothetical protein
MKTNRIIAVIAAALSLALSGPLWAAPRGKHIVEKFPHKHGGKSGTTSDVSHTVLKRTGPPGKFVFRRH